MLKITPHSPKAAEAQPLTADSFPKFREAILARLCGRTLFLAWRYLGQDPDKCEILSLSEGRVYHDQVMDSYSAVPADEQHTFTFQNQP